MPVAARLPQLRSELGLGAVGIVREPEAGVPLRQCPQGRAQLQLLQVRLLIPPEARREVIQTESKP